MQRRERDARLYRFADGTPQEVWQDVLDGAVLVSEPFAVRHALPVSGGQVEIATDHGARIFPVAGVFYDYSSDQGVVLMSDTVYRRFWDDRAISSLGVMTAAGAPVGDVAQAVRRALEGTCLLVQENAAIRGQALAIFDRTFAITAALRHPGRDQALFPGQGLGRRGPASLAGLECASEPGCRATTVELRRSPTIGELAEATGVTEEEVVEALESGRAYSSVSIFSGGTNEEDESLELLDCLGTEEEAYEVFEQRRVLAPAIGRLDPRERLILHMRFFEGRTQTEIANLIGISQMHVSRLIRNSIENLRLYMLEEQSMARSSPGRDEV